MKLRKLLRENNFVVLKSRQLMLGTRIGLLALLCLAVASRVWAQSDHAPKPAPAVAEAIQFVSRSGDDSNDGRTWASAKLTIYAAWNALPNASCNSGLSTCGGTMYVTNNVTWGGPVPGQGLRILGAKDPNRASPPIGWLVEKPVKIECVGPSQWDSNQAAPSCVVTGESGTQPAIWISGNAMPMEFDGIKVLSGSGSVLAKDSNGLFENNAGVTNITFRNCAFGLNNTVRTNGPGLRIGPDSFQVYIYSSVADGNPNAAGGTEARQAIVSDAGSTTNINSGLLFLIDSHLNSGGYENNPIGMGSYGSVVTNLVCEGQTDNHGCVWITNTTSDGLFTLSNIYAADTVPADSPGVEVNGNGPPDAVSATAVTSPRGPMILLQQSAAAIRAQVLSADKQHQTGFLDGHVLGQTDAARRGFSAVAVRFANLANSSPSRWTTGAPGVVTTGVTAPDGTTGAGTCSSSLRNANCYFYNAAQIYAVGDIIVVGSWARARNATGFNADQALGFFAPFCDHCRFVDISGQGGSSATQFLSSYIRGDGSKGRPPAEWEWYCKVLKVSATSGSAAQTQFVATVSATQPADYYGPIFLHIAARTISDNEAAELALNLQTYASSCSVGTICGLPDQTETPTRLGQIAANQFAGTARMSNGTVTVTFPTPYQNNPVCVANDTSSASNGIKPTAAPTNVVFSGAGNDSIAYICIGNPN